MKKILTLVAVFALIATVSCGGSSGGTPAEPTTADTKAAADAAMTGTIETIGLAVETVLASLTFSVSPLSLNSKDAEDLSYKTLLDPVPINVTVNCIDLDGGTSGSALVTGDVDLDCNESTGVCTILSSSSATTTFSDCALAVTKDSTTYNVTLNGSATSTITGSGSETSLSLAGSLSGTVQLTGDLTGTANMSGITWTANDVGVSCAGTSTITLTAPSASTETCSVSSTCDGCTL